MTETTKITDAQQQTADKIMASLKEDGRFEGKLWIKEDKCRIYIEEYGYLAIRQDGSVAAELRRYKGNITRAAGI